MKETVFKSYSLIIIDKMKKCDIKRNDFLVTFFSQLSLCLYFTLSPLSNDQILESLEVKMKY